MTLALSWGIQASHEMPLLIHPVSLETPHTATLSGLFCTTKHQGFQPLELLNLQLLSIKTRAGKLGIPVEVVPALVTDTRQTTAWHVALSGYYHRQTKTK